MHYYDLVLVAIAASLAIGVIVAVFTPISAAISISILGLLSIAIVGHALFVNGPIEELEDLTEPVEPEEVPGLATVAELTEQH